MQSVQQSYLLISLLFSDGKILEKRYGGKIHQYELRIITGGKNTAAPRLLTASIVSRTASRNSTASSSPAELLRTEVFPSLAHTWTACQSSSMSAMTATAALKSRGLPGRYIILFIAVYAGISIRILVDGRQCEFPPVTGLGKLYLYLSHGIIMLIG